MDAIKVFEAIGTDLNQLRSAITDEVNEAIKAKTPVLTGQLRDSFKVTGKTITTDVDYFLAVENGTPGRSPIGMVKRTMAEIQQILNRTIKKVTNNGQ